MKRKLQISPDTLARILQADKSLGYVIRGLKKAKNVGQAIADLEWARICIENAVRELKEKR